MIFHPTLTTPTVRRTTHKIGSVGDKLKKNY